MTTITTTSHPTSSTTHPPNRKLRYCVYVLQSGRDGQLYTGFTTNLRNRLTAHFRGQVESTATRRPFRLVYCEYHASETDARRREQYLKTTAGKKALKLMLRDSLAEQLGQADQSSPNLAVSNQPR